MARIVFVTDSASDLDPAVTTARDIRVVPLVVTFGADTYRQGMDLSTAEFWERMTAPDTPFPKTAAASPGDVKAIYDGVFAEGADTIISVHVAGTLSGAIKSAEIARTMLPDREIHVVNSMGASMAESILCFMGQELADKGLPAADIADILSGPRERPRDVRLARDAGVPQEGRPDQRRPGRSGRSSRSSRSSRSRTARSRRPTSRGPARSRASAASS